MNSFFFPGSVSSHSLTQKQKKAYELAEVGGSDQNYFEFWEKKNLPGFMPSCLGNAITHGRLGIYLKE